MEFHARMLKTRVLTQGRAFLGATRWLTTFWGSNSQKPSKMAFYKHVQASENGLETNDVIED